MSPLPSPVQGSRSYGRDSEAGSIFGGATLHGRTISDAGTSSYSKTTSPSSYGSTAAAAAGGLHGNQLHPPHSPMSAVSDHMSDVKARTTAHLAGGDVMGWPSFAKTMAREPEFRCFDRFQKLHVKTLMYYQVELARLEDYLEVLERRDAEMAAAPEDDDNYVMDNYASAPERMVPLGNKPAAAVSNQRGKGADPTPPEGLQWSIILRIRSLLQEYDTAILRYTKISTLPSPPPHNLKIISRWLDDPRGGDCQVLGRASEAWNVEESYDEKEDKSKSKARHFWEFVRDLACPTPDESPELKAKVAGLVSTLPTEKCDGFSLWIAHKFLPLWIRFQDRSRDKEMDRDDLEEDFPKSLDLDKKRKEDLRGKIRKYNGNAIIRFTSAVTFMVVATLPVAGIAVLAAVKPLRIRLGIIALFCFTVSGILLLLAKCNRMEAFMATAAFSAVLVVFVQNA